MAHLGNTIVNGALRVLGQATEDALQVTSINGVTVGNSPKFTDENNKVTQTATTANAAYEVLFSETADNTTRTEGSKKAATLRFNPGSAALMQGNATVASGSNSHAEGYQTTASGNQSHTEGTTTKATTSNAHAEGSATQAIGDSSHAEGYCTTASGVGAHAEGGNYNDSTSYRGTLASGKSSHAEGTDTKATGNFSHAEGWSSRATGIASHAEGEDTTASGECAHAEGQQTSAAEKTAHAEGSYTKASGSNAHAEGMGSIASSEDSHAEGYYTTASGSASHAEGRQTIASGNYSHASGQGTSAGGACQTVIGKYNVADTTSLFIIGNGNSSTRSNALCVNSDNTTTLGASGSIASGNTKAVNGGTVYSFVTGGSARDNTKVAKAGDTMTGCLKINSTTGDYTEGLRINLASNGYSTLTIGTANGSGNNISDGAFWIGTYTGSRKLYIAHNCSTQTATYFGADSSNAYSPYLNLGSSGTVENGNTRAVTGGAVYSFMQPGVKTFQVERGSSFSTSRQGYWAGMLRSDQSGSPTLPIANKWFHVLSMDWSNDSANWVSQLAIGTQDDPNSGVWWRCNDSGGTDISSSTWKHLVEDTQAPPQHSFDFTLTSDNNNKWYKVLSRGNGVPSTSSFKGIITISVAHYGYTNGTTKSFMVQSSYQSMTLYPFDSIGDEVGWLPTWRVSVDSTNMYVEFYVSGITSPAQNPFRITYTSLSNTHSGDPITFYDTLTASTATAVVQQYTIKAAFRTITRSELNDSFFLTDYAMTSSSMIRSTTYVENIHIRKNSSKIVNLTIWGTQWPVVTGAAVATFNMPSGTWPTYNTSIIGSDDNGNVVIGYITSGGVVYLANRTAAVYLNATYYTLQ